MALLYRILDCKRLIKASEPIRLHSPVGDFTCLWSHRHHAANLCLLSPYLSVEFDVDSLTIDIEGKECFTHFVKAARRIDDCMITVDLALLVVHHGEDEVSLLQHRPAKIVGCMAEADCLTMECTDISFKRSECRRMRFTKYQRVRVDHSR